MTETVAQSGREYVDIAVRLADDAAFMASVRATIREGLAGSSFTDMPAHTRHLEFAYVEALKARCPDVVSAVGWSMSEDALARARAAAAAAPNDATLQFRLAHAQEDAGQLAAAIASLRTAIGLRPEYAEAHAYLGLLLADTGDNGGAIASLKQAVTLKPDYVRAWNNLGSALRKAGQLTEAVDAIRKALALQPDYAFGHATLGLLERDLGDDAAAEASFRMALRRRPDSTRRSREPRKPVAAAKPPRRVRSALFSRDQAHAGRKRMVSTRQRSGGTRRLGQAREAFSRALAADPRHLRAALGLHLTLPMLYDSVEHIAAARAAYTEGLTMLERTVESCTRGRPPDEAVDAWNWSNFLLPYQGYNDKELQQRYAGLVARSIDTAAPESRHPMSRIPIAGRRIRVGFPSAFFKFGTVGMYFRRWITELDRSRFEIYVYHLEAGSDAIGNEIASNADHYQHLVGSRLNVTSVAKTIRSDELDVLIYLELGMHSLCFGLAALRLAPVQCATWGHPTTTGHPTIDYYLSVASMEPPDAALHYSERLVLLPGIGTQYSPPAIPEDTDRARFSLPEHRVLLLCPQSLFKIHPDNDDLLATVLAATPNSTLVLFEGRHPALTDKFMRRLERAFKPYGLAIRERAVVLPGLSHPDYLRVNLNCDAMLDTLHWSGGNTSLDAFACGLPVVTLAGALMRGRQTAGMLGVLGATDLIAANRDDYVRIAVRLATDAGWRNEQRARIASGRDRLFGDRAPIERLQAFLEDVAAADVP